MTQLYDNFQALADGGAGSPVGKRMVGGWITMYAPSGINDSWNVSSIVNNGVGDVTIHWDQDFLNAYYSVAGMAYEAIGSAFLSAIATTPKTAGLIRISTKDYNGNPADRTISIIAFGSI